MPRNGNRRAARQQQEIRELRAQVAAAHHSRIHRHHQSHVSPTTSTSNLPRCDWICGADLCQYLNYGHLAFCRVCRAPRRDGVDLRGQYRGQSMETHSFFAQRGRPNQRQAAQVTRTTPNIRPVGIQQPGMRGQAVAGATPPAAAIVAPTTRIAPRVPAYQRAPTAAQNTNSVPESSRPRESYATAASRAVTAQGNHPPPAAATPVPPQANERSQLNAPVEPPRSALQHFAMDNEGDGIADDDDGDSVHPADFPQPPTVQSVQRRFKKVETVVRRRQKKLTRQLQEVEQQREAVDEQQRILTTLQYDVDTTRDELHSLKQEMAELGQQLADITAAHAECEEQDNASDASSEDLNEATHRLAQVLDAVRNRGSFRKPALQQLVHQFLLEIQPHTGPHVAPPTPAHLAEGSDLSTPSRSPPPRTPSPRGQAPPYVATVQQVTGPDPSSVPSPQTLAATAQALESEQMWVDQRRTDKRKAPDIEVPSGRPTALSPIAAAEQLHRPPPLAICDRDAPHDPVRGGRSRERSRPRSSAHERKAMLAGLQYRVDDQRRQRN